MMPSSPIRELKEISQKPRRPVRFRLAWLIVGADKNFRSARRESGQPVEARPSLGIEGKPVSASMSGTRLLPELQNRPPPTSPHSGTWSMGCGRGELLAATK